MAPFYIAPKLSSSRMFRCTYLCSRNSADHKMHTHVVTHIYLH